MELDLSDITCVKCKVCMGNGDDTVCSDEFVSRAFQRYVCAEILYLSCIMWRPAFCICENKGVD